MKKSRSPSAEIQGKASVAELFTVGPRFTGVCQGPEVFSLVAIQRSMLPLPPARSESKKSARPSADKLGSHSCAAVLMVGPRFAGVSQPASGVALVVIHRSDLPKPPGRG